MLLIQRSVVYQLNKYCFNTVTVIMGMSVSFRPGRGAGFQRHFANFLLMSMKIRFDIEGLVTHGALEWFGP